MGEYFNRRLVEAVAPIIVSSERLYQDKFDERFYRRSLLGYFSKFWFPKELTDPSAQRGLIRSNGVLRVPPWVEYWGRRPKLCKGLLTPVPETTSVLLNGTFVSDSGQMYEQKPSRSRKLFATRWT